jgi:hypothetical protein
LADGIISADSLVFTLQNVEAADNDSIPLALRVSLQTNGQIQDQAQIHIGLSSANMILGGVCSSSQFGGVSAFSSDPSANQLEVVATQLQFSNITQPLAINTDFSATVCAVDVNGNYDIDSRDVTYSVGQGTGNLSSVTGLGPISALNACVSRNDLRYDVAETMVLRAGDNTGLTADTTLVFPMQSINTTNGNVVGLYPNPAVRGAHVHLTQPIGTWSVLDLTGRMVLQGQGKTIETAQLRPGLYLLKNAQGLTLRLSIQ